ncbi:malto-oligosyltrehalose synthase [Undibacterium arcticum]|uniref:malto-oligosyltrehalose synthase n=1 Tax=Undibacterium arcticum TaxID=1762892 RepID=UPI0036215A7E
MTIPRATVRLQFNRDFTLDDAARLVDYYAALGISHFYASPLQTARPGSTHGYDIVDPTAINPELGGEPALRRLVTRLRAARMGLILDLVPNHMGVGGSANRWWQHLLEWGRASPYADWFDIDWESDDPALRGKVLMPFLAERYGKVLPAGEIGLRFDETDGRIFAAYHAHRLPLSATDYPDILRTAGAQRLDATIAAFEQIEHLTSPSERQQQAGTALAMLLEVSRSKPGMADIDAALMSFSAAQPHALEQLHLLLQRQHYRLTCWRNAAEEINWRRFFEVSDLAGLRVEQPEVFEASHALVFRLYAQGLIDGVRIDHVDGLADPAGYCRLLRQRLQQLASGRPALLAPPAPYIVVEKILTDDERLRRDWGVDGTTGYEFMDQAGALLHDPDGARRLTALWAEWTGADAGFESEVRQARRQLLAQNLASECHSLGRLLHRLARTDVDNSDFSLLSILRVLTEILVHFPVYRTYVDAGGCDQLDRQRFAQVMYLAQQTLAPSDHPLLATMIGWLGTEASASSQTVHALRSRAIQRFQQITPALTAKSVEDTAFYRYGRLLSRNEVGANPGRFCIGVQEFHDNCSDRLRDFPHNLLATATHDHKRGEDLRARLAVLSELPDDWADTVQHWRQLNQSASQRAPQAADELMLYQMLAAAWPIDLAAGDAAGIRRFAARIGRWQTKALREAKRISNWFDPNQQYEADCEKFLYRILGDQRFLTELARWVRRITPAGSINSLSQTLLRMTTPGVPDLYQGTELWDFSLVDPDNRGAVDYALRQQLLNAAGAAAASLSNWQTGLPKLQIIQQTLGLRRRAEELFSQGAYEPLSVVGPRSQHIVAFCAAFRGASP